MRVILREMIVRNFQGATHRHLKFNSKENIIVGDNREGKTTLVNAYIWALSGKDSYDNAEFEIKALDGNNQVIETLRRADHEVILKWEVDSVMTEIGRNYLETWSSPKGAEPRHTGHTTTYSWNGVPIKTATEFNERLRNVVDMEKIKLLSNSNYFHSLHWEKRREIIFSLAGSFTDEDILTVSKSLYDEQKQIIKGILAERKTMKDAKAQNNGNKRAYGDKKVELVTRMKEAVHSRPEPVDDKEAQKNLDALQEEYTVIEKGLENTVTEMMDVRKKLELENQEYNQKLNALYDLRRKVSVREKEVENNVRNAQVSNKPEIDKLTSSIERNNSEINSIIARIAANEIRLKEYEDDIQKVRNEWELVNAEEVVYNEGDLACKECHRDYEGDDVESIKKDLEEKFRLSKVDRLSRITTRGSGLKASIEAMSPLMDGLRKELDVLKEAIDNAQKRKDELLAIDSAVVDLEALIVEALASDEELKQLKDKLKVDEVAIDEKKESTEDPLALFNSKREELNAKKTELVERINEAKSKLLVSETIKKIDQRVEDLRAEELSLSEAILKIDKIDAAILAFEKERVLFLEGQINHKFSFVKFKMFKDHLSSDPEPWCESMIGGVPYKSANTESQVNASLEIIDVLSKHYNIYLPVFIDNAERVTKYLELDTQTIKLYVKEGEKLKLNGEKVTSEESILATI